MKTFWTSLAGIAGVVIGAFIVLIFTGSTPPEKAPESPQGPVGPVNCFKPVPKSITFAGEEVPLQDIEVYERLDREIHVNTYFHSSTIQKIKLAARWFPVIEPILKKHGIPDDFKYLAVAESGLILDAASPAGARGMWQFLASTAREYGLTVNSYIDERYHPEKATIAACKYLKDAYEQFGNWTLVAASYNMGKAGLSRDLEAQQVDNYYDILLNSETSRYVFRILALKAILSDPASYGFCYDASDLYAPWEYKTTTVDTSITDLVDFASQQKTTYKTLKYYNPWLRDDRLILGQADSVVIKLPA